MGEHLASAVTHAPSRPGPLQMHSARVDGLEFRRKEESNRTRKQALKISTSTGHLERVKEESEL